MEHAGDGRVWIVHNNCDGDLDTRSISVWHAAITGHNATGNGGRGHGEGSAVVVVKGDASFGVGMASVGSGQCFLCSQPSSATHNTRESVPIKRAQNGLLNSTSGTFVVCF